MTSRGWDQRGVQRRERTTSRSDPWWLVNGYVRFYGFILLVGTKSADAVTTAVGLYLVPGIVETNPFADAVFGDVGIVTGLTVLSFATVIGATLVAEGLALEVRRRLQLNRLALFCQASIYGVLSLFFGAIAVHNGLLIAEQTQRAVAELLTLAGVFVPV